MAQSISFVIVVTILVSASLCFANKSGGGGGYLYPQFYDKSCTKAKEIIKSIVAKAVAKEARMAASLLRLHFHDCFVKGCDASILLGSSGSIISEKRSIPNQNSVRGFEVIDEIKYALEKACPRTVSCADIMAIVARDSTVISGGPSWEVPLGRRDSTGSHTIGDARCTTFRQRMYNQSGNGLADFTLEQSYASQLRARCPRSGGDQNLFFLDFVTPTKFDNSYFKNLLALKGLLSSDQILVAKNQQSMLLVKQYAENLELFFKQFAKSMLKMGNISPLTGSRGEIRTNCRKINS